MEPHPFRPETVAVTAGRPEAVPNAPLNPPLVLTSTYVARDHAAEPDDAGYGRWVNPTWLAFEEALGALEGGDGLLFASGMAAVAATLSLVPPGGALVVPEGPFYNGTAALMAQFEGRDALTLRPVDPAKPDAVRDALDGAAMLWIESPSNPLLEVVDVAALAALARSAGALTVVDNTVPTPLGQRPLTRGADVVVHSVTKYLSGHSDLVLGATVTRDEALYERLHGHRTLHGAVAGPFEAMLALRGLRTLPLRMERACSNAADLARRLATRPEISRVRHPSLPDDPGHELATAQLDLYGALISIELAGGPDAAERLCATTQLWVHATSLGGVESTMERRRRHPGESVAVPEGLVRLSVGVEHVEDLWADLEHALDHL